MRTSLDARSAREALIVEALLGVDTALAAADTVSERLSASSQRLESAAAGLTAASSVYSAEVAQPTAATKKALADYIEHRAVFSRIAIIPFTVLDRRDCDIAVGQIDIGNVGSGLTRAIAAGIAQPDGSVRGHPRMAMQAVVDTLLAMVRLPPSANVHLMTVMATKMPDVGRG